MTITPVKLTKPASLQTTVDVSARSLSIPQVLANPQQCSSLTQSVYRPDQQAKFLNLQAEVDSLLYQLQAIKEQRQHSIADSCPISQEQ